jgi:hypothetical protein
VAVGQFLGGRQTAPFSLGVQARQNAGQRGERVARPAERHVGVGDVDVDAPGARRQLPDRFELTPRRRILAILEQHLAMLTRSTIGSRGARTKASAAAATAVAATPSAKRRTRCARSNRQACVAASAANGIATATTCNRKRSKRKNGTIATCEPIRNACKGQTFVRRS